MQRPALVHRCLIMHQDVDRRAGHDETRTNAASTDELQDSAAPLDSDEEKRVVEEQSLNAATTHEVIRREGKKELERSASALAWSGMAAGFSMGLSFVAEGVLRCALPDATWRPLVVSFGYSVGFLAVILGSQQLFTENTLTPIVPFLTARDRGTFGKVLRLWGAVLLANLVGAWLFAEALARAHLLSAATMSTLKQIATESAVPSDRDLLLRGIGSGWIIALMVWMLPAASNSTPFVIVVMTWVVGAAQLPHVVVGAVEVLHLAAVHGTTFANAILHYIVPVLVGNIVGGVTLVSAVNHAQVVAGRSKRGDA